MVKWVLDQTTPTVNEFVFISGLKYIWSHGNSISVTNSDPFTSNDLKHYVEPFLIKLFKGKQNQVGWDSNHYYSGYMNQIAFELIFNKQRSMYQIISNTTEDAIKIRTELYKELDKVFPGAIVKVAHCGNSSAKEVKTLI